MSGENEFFTVLDCGDTAQCSLTPDDREEPIEYAGAANWSDGELQTPAGPVYRIKTKLDRQDIAGAWKARWGIGRMSYRIPPALYAVGDPGEQSPVLVSANYKLSFDYLRRELSGLNLWVLVIDTKGINVWCAAGKGTFGTAEVVRRIEKSRLQEVVAHRNLILPQLAAPGVAAHEVRRLSGFKVNYGSVRAKDIPAYLHAAGKVEPAMRSTRFGLMDRLVLTPVELANLCRPLLGLTVALLLLNLAALLLKKEPFSLASLTGITFSGLLPFLGAVLAGAVLAPALLPYIPGRALSWKGWFLGALWTLAYTLLIMPQAGWLQTAAYFLILPALAAFLAMNFTGSTTYTSLSGVIKEMGVALPTIILSASLGSIAFIAAFFI